MNATLQFDPTKYSEKTLQLILAKAEEWKCHPSEAVVRLLDQAADKARSRRVA
ncbi:MAG: hypothetical protein V4727_00485 [Verrucomicrobiota bacterium]